MSNEDHNYLHDLLARLNFLSELEANAEQEKHLRQVEERGIRKKLGEYYARRDYGLVVGDSAICNFGAKKDREFQLTSFVWGAKGQLIVHGTIELREGKGYAKTPVLLHRFTEAGCWEYLRNT